MSEPYFEADGITLYHGDCLEVTEWLAADVLVTDPPYGIAWPAGRLSSNPSLRMSADVQSIAGDESTAIRDEALAIWGANPSVVFASWRNPVGGGATHRLIWHKKGRYPGVSPHPFYPVDEEIYLTGAGWVGPPTPSVIATSEQRSAEPGRVGHPTPKPVGLMEQLISKCPPGVIADPFAGSGATLLAARNLGRLAIGVELEERYCEIIANRLAQQVLL